MSIPATPDGESALIGYTGFVGGTLLGQRSFDACFNSSNINDIRGRSFDLIVCCGARAEKWKANAEPELDLDNIEALTRALESANAQKVVLISTVDVFLNPADVDEDSPTPTTALHAYGRNRRRLEQIIAGRFDAHIVRLPGLYGHGLKKNVIYDFLNDNEVRKIDSRGVFQFYDVGRLWHDVETAMNNEIGLVHLPPEPVSVADVVRAAFDIEFTNEIAPTPARYDVHTKYADLFGGAGNYTQTKTEELASIATFVAAERLSRMGDAPRLAVSNIAWELAENDAVVALLRREGVSGVEIAPTKWRDKPFDASAADVSAYRRSWEDRGLRVVSLQALLFGRPDLQLFGDSRGGLADYLKRVIDFAAALGAHALVFGSPKNRVRGALSMSDAESIATEFFRDLGDYCAERGTALCIEANPVEYGCDFITTTAEAVALCRTVNHPGIRVNVDLGGITMSHEEATSAIEEARDVIGHYHASEPNLAEIGAASPHADAGRALREIGYAGWISIEMRAAGDNVAAIERALTKVRVAYEQPS